MNDNIKIVIVDSGVDTSHPAFIEDNIKNITIFDDNKAAYGHGTAIYNIIRNVRDICDIINIKINNIENGLCEREFLKVLKYIYDNISVDILNLSLGISVSEYYKDLYDICKKITDRGTIIIAAFDNSGSMSYPAAFDNVIGVSSSSSCRKSTDFEWVDDTVINVLGNGNVQRVAWTTPSYIMIGGNSFACAHTTVQAAKFMKEGKRSYKQILGEFKINSIKQHYISKKVQPVELNFKIKKAAIFPFNKEMHSLVRFFDMLDFEILDIYDIKYSGKIGAKTTHLMKDNVKEYIIKNIYKINWDNFDTLILGHLDGLSQLIDCEKLTTNLIKQAIKAKKNIYSFDDISKYTGSYEMVFYPKITDKNVEPDRFGKLYRVSRPVLGVFGTSSKQGKFTTQLMLRKELIKMGYSIGQIGTEPSALLYNMDYVFPMGYNNSVYIYGDTIIRYLNSMIDVSAQ